MIEVFVQGSGSLLLISSPRRCAMKDGYCLTTPWGESGVEDEIFRLPNPPQSLPFPTSGYPYTLDTPISNTGPFTLCER